MQQRLLLMHNMLLAATEPPIPFSIVFSADFTSNRAPARTKTASPPRLRIVSTVEGPVSSLSDFRAFSITLAQFLINKSAIALPILLVATVIRTIFS